MKKQGPFLLMVVTYAVLCVLVSVLPYEMEDPDSQVYGTLGRNMASAPLSRWCAPVWQGHHGVPTLFQDHPPGGFWVIALLIRAGFPADSAGMCANFLYILLTLYFLYRIASHFGGHIFGWGAVFSFLLTPIFLQYLVRANLEHALNLATMAGFYAFVRSQTSHGYKIFFIAALAVAGFVKGVGAIVLPLVALTYWAVALRSARSLFLIFAAGLVLLFLAAGFEIWYRETTDGVSFWWNYLHLQRGHVNPLHFFNNFFWYLPRVMWFAAPWVFYVLYGVYRARKSDVALLRDRFFVVSCLAATLVVFLYSLFDRRADRYIFSAYCLLAISGGWALLRLRPRVVELFKERQEVLPYWLSSALVILTLLRIGFHTQHQGWGWGE